MRHIRVSGPQAPELIEALLARDAAMPVRTLEEMLAAGEAGFGMLMVAVRNSLQTHRSPGYAHWAVVGLGEIGDPDAVPELTLLLRLASIAPAINVGFAAAEAIGKTGSPGEEMFLRAARAAPPRDRYWFHYAAARLGTEASSAFLIGEMEDNTPMADSAAQALAIAGTADALPAIDRALRRAASWQLPLMAEAVRSLAREQGVMGAGTRDWRLRYRYTPGYGRFPLLLPCLTALLRTSSRGRRAGRGLGRGIPRTVAEMLERDEPERPDGAQSCAICGTGRPRCHSGIVVCDACAPAATRVQADCLLAVERRSNDLFDILGAIDNYLMDRDHEAAVGEGYRRHILAQSARHWLVEQGIESAAAGAAMLLAEAETGPKSGASGA